ncbi:TetR/AcrR family transcriptional regulator [Leucobacter sp. M11]|uniref:TetR/AcrR family transcriptional regulator n=1 Tax=Leucobacter sp. M11 TaxID=2993565 RepID=UPI002D7F5128|nr:TetR family transcriptional regulator [Leucobacter sp. M11]MEB4613115.1 TetR family transcriptional regulator [Leucobacter sp. M11]
MTAPRATPTFTETARRAQIVASAIATVNALGYHRASLAEIARHAGIAKSAIVYYFGSKDALMELVMTEVFTKLGATVVAAVTAATGHRTRLRAYAESSLRHTEAHPAEIAAAVTVAVSHRNAAGTPVYLEPAEEDTALLREILSAGMAAGEIRGTDPATAVAIVEALLDVPVTAVQRDPAAPLAALNQEVLHALDRWLRP